MPRLVLLLVVLVTLALPAPAFAFTKTGGTQTMDDGVTIAYDVYLPDGTTPAAGHPGVVVLHGLGGKKESVAPLAQSFAGAGYAVLAYDARGHGASGGSIELASSREVADLRALRNAFAGRADVSDTAIGAWGVSYGGGQTWNALVAGVPFAAAAVLAAWTDLYTGLWPQGIARSGLVYGFAAANAARSPLIAQLQADAIRSTNLERIRSLLAERSALARVGAVRTPVYMFQGRQDFVFDIAQATQAFARLAGPKKLYVGTFGHYPATIPGPDDAHVTAESIRWADRFLKGMPNGVDTGSNVSLAAAGGSAPAARYQGLPKTRTHVFALRGTSTARGEAFVTRRSRPLRVALETWGGGTVSVRITRLASYPRLVVTVRAGKTVVTHGAVRPKVGVNTVRLASYAVHLLRGTRLSVTIGPASPSPVFAYTDFKDSGSIAIGSMTLRLAALPRPVSR